MWEIDNNEVIPAMITMTLILVLSIVFLPFTLIYLAYEKYR